MFLENYPHIIELSFMNTCVSAYLFFGEKTFFVSNHEAILFADLREKNVSARKKEAATRTFIDIDDRKTQGNLT